jgi:hypothetical protein
VQTNMNSTSYKEVEPLGNSINGKIRVSNMKDRPNYQFLEKKKEVSRNNGKIEGRQANKPKCLEY